MFCFVLFVLVLPRTCLSSSARTHDPKKRLSLLSRTPASISAAPCLGLYLSRGYGRLTGLLPPGGSRRSIQPPRIGVFTRSPQQTSPSVSRGLCYTLCNATQNWWLVFLFSFLFLDIILLHAQFLCIPAFFFFILQYIVVGF